MMLLDATYQCFWQMSILMGSCLGEYFLQNGMLWHQPIKTWYMVHGIHFFFPFALKALLLFMLIIIIITVGTFTIWLLFRHGLINFCFWKPLLKNCYFCFLMIKIDHAHSQSFIPQFYFCCQCIREMNLQ